MTDIVKEIQELQEENEQLQAENEELKEELGSQEVGESLTSKVPFKVGKKYLIRTVTFYVTGKVKKISGYDLWFGSRSRSRSI